MRVTMSNMASWFFAVILIITFARIEAKNFELKIEWNQVIIGEAVPYNICHAGQGRGCTLYIKVCIYDIEKKNPTIADDCENSDDHYFRRDEIDDENGIKNAEHVVKKMFLNKKFPLVADALGYKLHIFVFATVDKIISQNSTSTDWPVIAYSDTIFHYEPKVHLHLHNNFTNYEQTKIVGSYNITVKLDCASDWHGPRCDCEDNQPGYTCNPHTGKRRCNQFYYPMEEYEEYCPEPIACKKYCKASEPGERCGNCGDIECSEGYKEENGRCNPECFPLCENNSTCSKHHICECLSGYEGVACQTLVPSTLSTPHGITANTTHLSKSTPRSYASTSTTDRPTIVSTTESRTSTTTKITTEIPPSDTTESTASTTQNKVPVPDEKPAPQSSKDDGGSKAGVIVGIVLATLALAAALAFVGYRYHKSKNSNSQNISSPRITASSLSVENPMYSNGDVSI